MGNGFSVVINASVFIFYAGGMQMKKLINGVDNVVDEMLRGMAAAHPESSRARTL